MPTLIDSESRPARHCERLRRARESVARLPAAMQQDRRAIATAVRVGGKLVAGRADEGFGFGGAL
jgi:hypothetical protein